MPKIRKESFLKTPNYFLKRFKTFSYSDIQNVLNSLTDDEIISILKYEVIDSIYYHELSDVVKKYIVLNPVIHGYRPNYIDKLWDTFSIDEKKLCIRKGVGIPRNLLTDYLGLLSLFEGRFSYAGLSYGEKTSGSPRSSDWVRDIQRCVDEIPEYVYAINNPHPCFQFPLWSSGITPETPERPLKFPHFDCKFSFAFFFFS
jgi:hypothetical protein